MTWTAGLSSLKIVWYHRAHLFCHFTIFHLRRQFPLAEGLDVLDFYRDPATRLLYKQHMSHMVNRVNTFTGVKYRGESGA